MGKPLQDLLDKLKLEKPSDPITPADVEAAVAAHMAAFQIVLVKYAKKVYDEDFGESNGALLSEVGLRELL